MRQYFDVTPADLRELFLGRTMTAVDPNLGSITLDDGSHLMCTGDGTGYPNPPATMTGPGVGLVTILTFQSHKVVMVNVTEPILTLSLPCSIAWYASCEQEPL